MFLIIRNFMKLDVLKKHHQKIQPYFLMVKLFHLVLNIFLLHQLIMNLNLELKFVKIFGLLSRPRQQRQRREPTLSLIFPLLMKRQARRNFAANSCVCSPHGPCAHTFMHLRARVSRQRIWFSPDICSRPPAGASRRNPFGRPA